jgi:hypothetical protein
VITKFSSIVRTEQKEAFPTYLGFIKCVAVNIAPRRIHNPPTTIYAIPRNGFFPPMTVLVVIKIDFVPPYKVVLNSRFKLD